MTGVRYHLDHVIPESLGGTDDVDNLALACPTCNYHKANHLFGMDEQGLDGPPLVVGIADSANDLDSGCAPSPLELALTIAESASPDRFPGSAGQQTSI